jgi:hypothetical protein
MTAERNKPTVNILVDRPLRRREDGPESDDARYEGWKWKLHECGPDE